MKDKLIDFLIIFLMLTPVVILSVYEINHREETVCLENPILDAYAFNYMETVSLHKKDQLKNLIKEVARIMGCRIVKGTDVKAICPNKIKKTNQYKIYLRLVTLYKKGKM